MIRCLGVAVCLLAGGAIAAQGLDEPAAARRPVPPIVAPVEYHLTFQEQPRFPDAKRPEASKPAAVNGLSITIQPEREEFPANGPLAFEVALTNETDKAFLLYDAKRLGGRAKLVVTNLKSGAQWTVGAAARGPDAKAAARESVAVEPGKSLKVTVVVEPQTRPVPLPRPRPIPLPQELRRDEAGQPAGGQGANAGRRIIIAPFPPMLPSGTGPCRVRLLLEFGEHPDRDRIRFAHRHWTGRIATNPADFTVAAAQPLPPGPVPPIPPVAGPLTKEQAVTLAQAAAEQALSANYESNEPLRPAHAGQWIESPEKTASVKDRAGGGWTVQWTHFPKGRGFSYNVTIDVDANGRTTVREVFTGYSARP
ncbi:MAG TPA: hypothetical protein VML55_23265 [Planctomycetaceae bacterium]|nr:hypothetical protein [Planctomycetaceae bacterium]